MATCEALPTILYIAGYGRSGSTVLDMLLDTHSAILGTGELTNVFSLWASEGSCSCQKVYQCCPFWAPVMERFRKLVPGISFDQAARTTRSVESIPRLGKRSQGPRPTANGQYRDIWTALLEAIVDVGKSAVVVDSSKNTRYTFGRVKALVELCGFDVKVVHLVRDPRAVMWSMLRGSNQRLEMSTADANSPQLFGGAYRGLLGWSVSNLSVHMLGMTREIGVLRVRYEDLVADPAAQLERIGRAFGLEVASVVDKMQAQQPLQPGHGVAGNRLRRQGDQFLRVCDEWKYRLPTYARRIAVLSWPLARIYSYQVCRGTRSW